MNLLQDLSRQRFKHPLFDLIPAGFCMAWPMRMENELWYLPFFSMEKRKTGYLCKKEAEIVFSYPEFKLNLYRRSMGNTDAFVPCKDISKIPENLYTTDLPIDILAWYELFRDNLPKSLILFYPEVEGEINT